MEILSRLPTCPIEEIDMYWKKNLEYRIFEKAHIVMLIVQNNKLSLILPLNRSINVQKIINISRIIQEKLSTYDVTSKGTSVYLPIV